MHATPEVRAMPERLRCGGRRCVLCREDASFDVVLVSLTEGRGVSAFRTPLWASDAVRGPSAMERALMGVDGGRHVVADAERGLLAMERALTAADRPWSAFWTQRWFSSGGRVLSEGERGSPGTRVVVS